MGGIPQSWIITETKFHRINRLVPRACTILKVMQIVLIYQLTLKKHKKLEDRFNNKVEKMAA